MRQANAAITLLLIGRDNLVWPYLRLEADKDPTVRSHIIHRLAMEEPAIGRVCIGRVCKRLQELNRGGAGRGERRLQDGRDPLPRSDLRATGVDLGPRRVRKGTDDRWK